MDARVLDELFETVKSRKGADPGESWTARLMSGAPDLPAQKVTEEAAEVLVEAVKGDNGALTREAADLLYHLLVLLAAQGVELGDVWKGLKSREGTSGIAEKASRGE